MKKNLTIFAENLEGNTPGSDSDEIKKLEKSKSKKCKHCRTIEKQLYTQDPELNRMLIRLNKNSDQTGMIYQHCHRCYDSESVRAAEGYTVNSNATTVQHNLLHEIGSNFANEDSDSEKSLSVTTFQSQDRNLTTRGCLGCVVMVDCTCEERNTKIQANLKNAKKRKRRKRRKRNHKNRKLAEISENSYQVGGLEGLLQ